MFSSFSHDLPIGCQTNSNLQPDLPQGCGCHFADGYRLYFYAERLS
jgi:hypothetical protein